MKIVDTYYVLIKLGNIEANNETVFLSADHKFTSDIREALKCSNRRTALDVKHYYEVAENNCSECDLKIIPLKISYEW